MKGPKIEIKIGGKSDMEDSQLAPELSEAEMADEEMVNSVAPTGQYTAKGLNALVNATNATLPLFEQTPDYPKFSENLTKLPTDFVRVLMMFQSAVDDAIAQEVLPQDMAFDLTTVKDDSALITLAGKLSMISKSKEFKKFLKEPPKDENVSTEAAEEAGMSSEEEDKLMMERM
jgi:hypothetical protein